MVYSPDLIKEVTDLDSFFSVNENSNPFPISWLGIVEPSLKWRFTFVKLIITSWHSGRVLEYMLLLFFSHLAIPHSHTSLDLTALFNPNPFTPIGEWSEQICACCTFKVCPRRKNPPIKAGITIKKSRVNLVSLRFPLPCEPYVIVSNHTALHFKSNHSDLP